MRQNTDRKTRLLRFIGMVLIAIILMTSLAFASTGADFGKNAGEWLLAQIFWIALIAVAIVLIKLLLARNYTAMLITTVVSAVSLFIIKDPQRLQTIGETLWTTVFK